MINTHLHVYTMIVAIILLVDPVEELGGGGHQERLGKGHGLCTDDEESWSTHGHGGEHYLECMYS